MIPLEKQVTSLEPSMRLKELGVKQDSLWYWHAVNYEHTKYDLIYIPTRPFNPPEFCYSAFTVAEHGIALPRSTHSYRDTNFVEEFWVCEQRFKSREFADTEADARAKMRIYLIERKLVERANHQTPVKTEKLLKG